MGSTFPQNEERMDLVQIRILTNDLRANLYLPGTFLVKVSLQRALLQLCFYTVVRENRDNRSIVDPMLPSIGEIVRLFSVFVTQTQTMKGPVFDIWLDL